MLAPGGLAGVFAALVEVYGAEGPAELGASVVQVVLIAHVDVTPVRYLHVAVGPRALHEVRVEHELDPLLHRAQRHDVCRAELLALAVGAEDGFELGLLDLVQSSGDFEQRDAHFLVFEEVDLLGVEVVEGAEVQADARELELYVGGHGLVEADLVGPEARRSLAIVQLDFYSRAGVGQLKLLAEGVFDGAGHQDSLGREQQRERQERLGRGVDATESDAFVRDLAGEVEFARVLFYDQIF